MRTDDRMRVSDADREHVTARLREHFAEGRLTPEELDERVTATLGAKTYGDLRRVMADLPEPAPVAPPGAQVPPQSGAQQWGARQWGPSRRSYAFRRRPRLLPLLLVALILAVVLPGAGFVFFTIVKVLLLAWLAFFVVGIVAAAFAAHGFRRHLRRYWQESHGAQWHQFDWRNW
jgi:hypothetical protein